MVAKKITEGVQADGPELDQPVNPLPERAPEPQSPAPALKRPPGELARLLVLRLVLPASTFLALIVAWTLIQSHLVTDLPTTAAIGDRAVEILSDPFYDHGPNDKGIGWQILFSLGRVMAGFGLAVLIGVPVGLLIGSSPLFHAAWQPLFQIMRPVSPLAWLPLGLLLFQSVDPAAIFVIFITCIWPTIINTAAGVVAIPKDYMNVAAVLQLGRWEVVRRILLPATLPYIITGMRLSLGIAWMVIVAAEMLTGGIGIGFYIWDEWNNLNVATIIVCIGLIGLVGIALDAMMDLLQRRFNYSAG
jgi:nitrate/nitrite transport system permease protein